MRMALKVRWQWLTPVTPALWEAEAGRPPEVGSSRSAWLTWRNPVSTKKYKISQAWWRMPVIPATQEAEAGEPLEPRRQRLQQAEIMPLHSSLGNKSETLSQKTKQNKKTENKTKKPPKPAVSSDITLVSGCPTGEETPWGRNLWVLISTTSPASRAGPRPGCRMREGMQGPNK